MCVQDWCPYMPLAPDKPYLYVEGEGKVELEGVALMCPELNQKELIEGGHLSQVFERDSGNWKVRSCGCCNVCVSSGEDRMRHASCVQGPSSVQVQCRCRRCNCCPTDVG